MAEDDRLPVLCIEAELAETRMLRQDLRRADAELCRVLKENEDLWKENERLKAMLRSLPTTPKTELQIRVALGHVPTREEIIASLETPADRCATHALGALGKRCPVCGDVIDGSSKEQRQSLREEIADHVLKDWRRP
jgi:DNA repair exonuclease SbcCD ATPase subunit